MKTYASLILGLSLFIAATSAVAKSTTTPEITFQFISKDLQPVQGVGIGGHLSYEVLSFLDSSDVIPVPIILSGKLARYKSQSGEFQDLGVTDETGRLVISEKTWSVFSLSARDLSVQIFTNGLIKINCDSPTKYRFVDLLPQFLNSEPVARNQECNNVRIDADTTEPVVISCVSPLTSQEINAKIAEAIESCGSAY